MDVVTYIIKIFFISICTYYTFLKITNRKKSKKGKWIILVTILIDIISGIIKYQFNSLTSTICLIFMLSGLYAIVEGENIGYSILGTIISFSINNILFFMAISINYLINNILLVKNDYINLFIMMVIHTIILFYIFKIKRFKDGLSFLNRNDKSEYFDILILSISVVILFLFIAFTSFDKTFTRKIFFIFIAFAIIMFITIQKCLQLYYKQKLMVQELEETKAELEEKKQEIQELERENLNFSKVSHSIAHKQKSLEYKLNELMLKTEIGSELDLKDRLKNATKELQQDVIIKLDKTGIPEVDDMLAYMQSECAKEKIDFQVQLSGNIHYMVNHYVAKEKLEILLADHIKNAIIAIQCSTNSNKSILVKLGIIEGVYSLYIYDSGIEFEVETFPNLGKKPSTTHADRGGTGMGFMNTFDTLKQYQASMIIQEYGEPCPEDFTKVIQIKFDKKKEFKISSYREEKINLP